VQLGSWHIGALDRYSLVQWGGGDAEAAVCESPLNSRSASFAAQAWAMTSNNAMQPTAASELAVTLVAALLGGG
jgi:hypothetical protein